MSTTVGGGTRMLRIGEVVRRLSDEFPDISISKIRFLEDEGLLMPQRTRGGYRLFSEDDLERLTTILRLQRDEFLPLRVIRDELSAPGVAERKRRRPAGLAERVQEIDLDELCRRAGTKPQSTAAAIAAPRMNPRASAPRMTSGFFCFAQVASPSIVVCRASRSASSGVMSLKPTPGVGKSGTSRIFERRSITRSPRRERRARAAVRSAPARAR